MKKSDLPEICLIVSSDSFPEKVETALEAGIRWIQLREKSLIRREILNFAEKLRKLTSKYNCLLTINDHLDIAIAVEADGVHLGQDDFPAWEAKRIFSGTVGLSTHNIEEVKEAQKIGVDYIGFGPMFQTKTKKDALPPRSLEEAREAIKISKIPVLLIGGIRYSSLSSLSKIGMTHVAVSSGILEGDVAKNVSNFIKFFETQLLGENND